MARYRILNRINSPEDLSLLDGRQLRRYCAELRDFLIHSVSHTGGHLASNLGVVELTAAIHRVFQSPRDQIIWDVGHQCYPHKIITGRRQAMASLRQKDGISGFPRPSESEHDAFVAGHSSTSISIADGIARAKLLLEEEGHVVAVIGDGAFTGGMAFEGLNNITQCDGNVIIILNDNKMSISKNVGGLTAYLSRLRTYQSYFSAKDLTKTALQSIPVVGDSAVNVVSRSKAYLKNALYNTSFFEEMGFTYMGPVDGHNLSALQNVLSRAKEVGGPVFIHVETVKGRGYELAEQNPGAYHGVSHFDPREGSEDNIFEVNFSTAFGQHLAELAQQDSRICAVTAAMKYATGLHFFSSQFKKKGRFFDVGIAEQHAVTFSAALAAKGLVPVFAVYSTFLQRAYDQLLHDCCIEPKHVVLAVDRAGLVGADGETHQGLYDCAFLSSMPGTAVYSPASYQEVRDCLEQAVNRETGLCAVRYPRGQEPKLPVQLAAEQGDYAHWSRSGSKVLFVTYGRVSAQVADAAEKLSRQGTACDVLRLLRIWPLDDKAVEIASRFDSVVFVEEGIRAGGIGEHFLSALMERGFRGRFAIRAVEGVVPPGTVEEQMLHVGLDSASLVTLADTILAERKSS